MVQKPCRIGSICFCFRSIFFVFHSEWICCPFKNTESDITWWDSHIKLDLCCMWNWLWMFLIWFYISRFDYMNRIGSTKIGRGLVGAGGELRLRPCSSRCALAARAVRLRRMLAARAHSQLLPKIYEFVHDNCKKYMNSYIIWIHICMISYILGTTDKMWSPGG